ncbi:Ppx/GppA phosphatase family protein [Arsenicibacter rosenii]|uniref:Phosphatase n=1 Tax=Arsenicibacter rosenii TaxID=1750698 RepID=A0A1S2VR33_9BACT|nr:phosphatase [Arsenicibacter rosenii]OIN61247.1 phosphatase [Arsenicibacter rosenii]
MKQAVIDLGTNTFHLMVVERAADGTEKVLFRESRPAKIGKAGINQGMITEEAIGRALGVLGYFREQLDRLEVPVAQVVAIGTSAIRVAKNQAEFIERVREATGIRIQVISGDQEAGYIYHGVKASGALNYPDETCLIVDIGGGSVEFIISARDRILWKQSFEIGGQRLMERFMPDPQQAISGVAVRRLRDYLQEQLLPLVNALHQYSPRSGAPLRLVGSSGTFDTLVDMWFMHSQGIWPPASQAAFELPVEEFYRSFEQLMTRNHDERMQLPGMIELRVDMIVVAVCLIDYLIRTFGIRQISTSTYSLKEGVLATMQTSPNGWV